MRYFIYIIVVFLLVSCASPKAVFTYEKDSASVPVVVKFNNLSEKAISYFWDFGDGKTSEEANPIHKYTLSGKHMVTLTAKDTKKSNVTSKEIFLDHPHHCLIEMHTSLGNITLQLYDETPGHRDNFLKLIDEEFYEEVLFHRVIKGFMIQGGDGSTKNAGTTQNNYTIPAEMRDTLVHLKGALCAARTGDRVNPEKASSGTQFYIVQGRPVTDDQLDNFELQKNIKYTPYARKYLTSIGGTPNLDMEYTVFGKVVKGLDIVDKIADSATNKSDRPLEEIKILSIKIIK